MEAYLDNSATTRVFPEVVELMVKTMSEDYGNPSSMHTKGVEAEQYIKEATKTFAQILKVQEKEIYYTSGGTESDNWALIGTALANRRTGNHIVVTAMEHPAVGAVADFLEKQGFAVTRLSVDEKGRIDPEKMKEAVREDTIVVSMMYVNNEIGAVQDIAALSRIIKEKNPHTYVHVDAIQAFGKYHIYPKRMGIDMLSVSSHKLHGPKGVGLLYIDEKVKIVPIIYGGGQQKGMRSGTDNVPGIAGFALAANLTYTDLDSKVERMYQLKQKLVDGLLALGDVHIHGMAVREGAPHIVSAAFVGVRSEVLLHTLEREGIYVSTGSACSSNKKGQSHVLKAMGLKDREIEGTIRFSLGRFNTEDEADTVIEKVTAAVNRFRRLGSFR